MARPPKDKVEVLPAGDVAEMFTAEELKALDLEAKAEFEAAEREKLAEAYKEETKLKLRREALHKAGKNAEGSEVEAITIDLAPHAAHISINGHQYYHGVEYKVPKSAIPTFKEIMHRTWVHEKEVGGANTNAAYGLRPQNRTLTPHRGA